MKCVYIYIDTFEIVSSTWPWWRPPSWRCCRPYILADFRSSSFRKQVDERGWVHNHMSWMIFQEIDQRLMENCWTNSWKKAKFWVNLIRWTDGGLRLLFAEKLLCLKGQCSSRWMTHDQDKHIQCLNKRSLVVKLTFREMQKGIDWSNRIAKATSEASIN